MIMYSTVNKPIHTGFNRNTLIKHTPGHLPVVLAFKMLCHIFQNFVQPMINAIQ